MLKIEIIAQKNTLFISLFIYNIEHCSLLMLPFKTTSENTQDGATHLINYTEYINTTNMAMVDKKQRLGP